MSGEFGNYDFDLTQDEEARAARLHDESVIIDTLFQGPLGASAFTPEMDRELQERLKQTGDRLQVLIDAMELPGRLALKGELPEYRAQWAASGITAVSVNVELGDLAVAMRAFAMAQAQFDGFDWLTKALTAADIRRAKAERRHAGFMNTQLVTGPFATIELLDAAYDLGVRMIQLTYNSLTTVGAGCTERTDAGVSYFGARAIARMNELGIIVDTGHCGRQTTLDACELSSTPVVASHTAADAVYPHQRAKDDDEIRALAATGGTISVVAVPFFLSSKPDATIEAMLDHVDHIAELVGPEHAAVGTDWPMQLSSWALTEVLVPLTSDIGFRPEHGIRPDQTLVGFADYRDFRNITRGLVKRGYSDDEIRGILGGNFLRVFEQVCG